MIPDLLYPRATYRIDFDRTKLAVTLAFAGGTSGGLFTEALATSRLPASTWDAGGFSSGLFLQHFVTECYTARIGPHAPVLNGSFLMRVLSSPPSDPAIVVHRREVLGELSSSAELRGGFERLYVELCRLRALIENSGGGRVWDANRRKLDVLTSIRAIIEHLHAGFASASSALRGLHDFGARVRDSEAYQSLQELLRYDAHLATLNMKVVVGADGRIRKFDLLSVKESEDNVFVNPFWRRWLAKFELFVRGYRFGDEEIMARLVDSVFTGIEEELVTLVQLFGDLEFYLGALGFLDRARSSGLSVCLPELTGPDEPKVLQGLFNPLLLVSGVVPVPCDLAFDATTCITLVTGPNSGGKTRLLQSLGLTQLLAQNGVFIPARAGKLTLATALVTSLIEEAKVEQAEGRLGTELLRIRSLFERLPPGAMVLLDELCSGTNPSEGEQIFELVVRMLSRLRPQAFITTHFLAFAARLEQSRKIEDLGFLQVELDPQRRPTYQFVPGVARTSLAGHTAERLGVTGDQLLQLIEQNTRKYGLPFAGTT